MKIEPKILNNVCISTHPEGIVADVKRQIEYVRGQKPILGGPKNVLIIGSSAGFGLASRISLAFGAGAATMGVAFEKEGSAKRPGTPGHYCTAAFDAAAKKAGLRTKSINGDAFSDEIKQEVIAAAKGFGTEGAFEGFDMVVYSLASPVRTDPKSGETYRSVLKPIGRSFESRTVDFMSGKVSDIRVEPATEEEQLATINVMGGTDWVMWLDALLEEGLLAKGAQTVAYSYIGPELTYPIYWNGTIGGAKKHLEETAVRLNRSLAAIQGRAFISVNKALVTRASSVIPVVPLYVAILYKIMKAKGLHEECIEQMYRLFAERFRGGDSGGDLDLDEKGYIRIDDREMRDDVQAEVAKLWAEINSDNLARLSDIEGFRESYLRIHGFGIPGIDYEADIDPTAMPEL
ncbi:trans-2-enoyl-CoA reductase family protein [Candidatus Haliotispira prima]|uniref:Trans-2-enoyl-CoA reductase [NADH] n=1 Tax=Candidatus Haliotispira prima TaxID=3034016 RepID=A0ABY8MHQ7_9SPIO|nr:trans-2-enoyl-CoA reductase family protein [Candidatus Haliotispira prima]